MDQVRQRKLLSSPRLAWSLAMIAGALAAWGWLRHIEAPPAVEQADKPAETVAQAPAEPVHQEEAQAADDGMYVSPTAGPPLDLRYLPQDTEAFVALRPADLMRLPEGRELLTPEMLGDFAKWLRHFLPQTSGTTLGNIEQLLIGSKSNDLHHCLVLRFRDPVPMADLIATKEWHAEVIDVAGQQVLRKNNRGYWQPPAEGAHAIVIVQFPAMQSIIRGAPLNLHPATLALLGQSDSQRHFTFVGTPYYFFSISGLFNEGGNLLLNPAAWFLTGFEPTRPGHDDARRALSPIKAVLFSGHLDDERAFAELLVAQPNAGNDVESIKPFRNRIDSFGRLAARYVSTLDENPLSRSFALVYPERVRALSKYTRVGASDDQIMMRAYLPKQAPRELLRGASACLGRAYAMWDEPDANLIEGKLNRRTTLGPGRNTPEKMMALLSEDLGFPITVRDHDLQLEGMTRTSFPIDEDNKPAREILLKILKQWNPDGKLVYIINPRPDGSQEMFITTRAAVFKNHEQLPVEFGGITGLLDRRTTLSIPRDSMEPLLKSLSNQTGIPIAIRPHDLMLEGITKGISCGIHEVDRPAREILRKILKSFQPDEKLVYIIRPKLDDSGEEIVVTTRRGAVRNGERLPPEYGGVIEQLNRRMWLSFYHDTLAGSMSKLSDGLGFPITVREGDLQSQGVALEKTFGIYEANAPHREILRRILKKVSPDDKLVYVIKSSPDGAEEIVITTRAAALKNGETLPPEYGPINDLLNQKTTLAFDHRTLQDALQFLSEKTGLAISIREQDLPPGVTAGPPYRVHETDRPAREIITSALKHFNSNGQLIYIVKPKPDNTEAEVVITTCAAAAKNGETLPPEFDGFQDRLNRTTSLPSGDKTLEIAVQILSSKADIPITIRRQDLELAGYSWDRQRRIQEVERPARQILMELLDWFGGDEFVYIIKPKPDGSGEEIIITTRAAAAKNGEPLPPQLGGITELLNRRITLSFVRNTPTTALQLWSQEAGIPLTIREFDLKFDGITKGNAFGIHAVDQPAREVLAMILIKTDRDDKVVYIIKPKPDNSGEEVVITTRSAVVKNKERFPPQVTMVAERLQRRMSFSYPPNSLYSLIERFSEESGIPIMIRVKDLRLEGITEDEKLVIQEPDKPACEILDKILKSSRPDATIVYIIKPRADGSGEEIIIITTREAAEKNGEKLPPEFEKETKTATGQND